MSPTSYQAAPPRNNDNLLSVPESLRARAFCHAGIPASRGIYESRILRVFPQRVLALARERAALIEDVECGMKDPARLAVVAVDLEDALAEAAAAGGDLEAVVGGELRGQERVHVLRLAVHVRQVLGAERVARFGDWCGRAV